MWRLVTIGIEKNAIVDSLQLLYRFSMGSITDLLEAVGRVGERGSWSSEVEVRTCKCSVVSLTLL